MMRIECPWCGERPENEFHCGGSSHIERPAADCSDEAWADYLFTRANPMGPHAERWRHSFGCGQWFNVVRDTVTHEIACVYKMGEPRPESTGEPRPESTGEPRPESSGEPTPETGR